jgi:hypothetical protein
MIFNRLRPSVLIFDLRIRNEGLGLRLAYGCRDGESSRHAQEGTILPEKGLRVADKVRAIKYSVTLSACSCPRPCVLASFGFP